MSWSFWCSKRYLRWPEWNFSTSLAARMVFSLGQWKMIRGSCWLSFAAHPIRIYPRVPYWLFFKIYAFPHFDTEQWILSLTYWVGVSGAQKDIYGGQSETFLRRLQQELFSPLDNGNDQRQLLAQFRSTSNLDISSGALLVVLQDICFPPPYTYTLYVKFMSSYV